MIQVSELMTRGVRTLAPADTLQRAAQAMDELDVGAVPVCDGRRLVGMITDRDIAVRGVAKGRPVATTHLSEVMSTQPQWCFDDAPLDEAMGQMRDAQIRRLPVVDRERRLVGILSLGDVAASADAPEVAGTLACISEPLDPERSGSLSVPPH